MGGRNGGWTVRPEILCETAIFKGTSWMPDMASIVVDNAIKPCAQVLHAPSQQAPPQP